MTRDHLAAPDTLAAIHGAAIQGRRPEQQDSFSSQWLPADGAWLLVLADGMGGHAGGQVASRTAVDTFVAAFTQARLSRTPIDQAFKSALEKANARLAAAQDASPQLTGMGTTLVGVLLSAQGLAWISVGDSPLWLLRGNRLERLNEDHSLRSAVAAGVATSGNLLLSALNGQETTLVDLHAEPVPLRAGDLVVLASDGLLTLTESEIISAARLNADGGPEQITQAILRAVEMHGKSNQDNCAVVLAAVS